MKVQYEIHEFCKELIRIKEKIQENTRQGVAETKRIIAGKMKGKCAVQLLDEL